MKHLLTVLGCLALLAPAPLAHAQGVQTGTITGSVKSADGLSLPGVTVITSGGVPDVPLAVAVTR